MLRTILSKNDLNVFMFVLTLNLKLRNLSKFIRFAAPVAAFLKWLLQLNQLQWLIQLLQVTDAGDAKKFYLVDLIDLLGWNFTLKQHEIERINALRCWITTDRSVCCSLLQWFAQIYFCSSYTNMMWTIEFEKTNYYWNV